MLVSPDGLKLIEKFEGLRLHAYQDIGGVWTIGYGHTKDVQAGDVISIERADALLQDDVFKTSQAVASMLRAQVTQNQFDALVSFAYNVGSNALHQSTLLRFVNARKWAQAADQFLVWNHVKGVESAGLTRRRQAERALFMTPTQMQQASVPQTPTT
jgi:lysozyme